MVDLIIKNGFIIDGTGSEGYFGHISIDLDMINEKYWGKGIVTKAVKVIVEYLFHDIGINRIQALAMPENVVLKEVLLKNGFTKEGLIRQANLWF